MNNKVRAYTLSELIIVLILTSIVVGLSFSVLALVQKQMLSIQENYNKNLELNKLQTALWIDFNRYPTIRYNSIENDLMLKNELDSVFYKFHKDFILKNNDTINVQIETKQFYFDGEISKTNQLDAIKLTTSKDYQNRELFIYKKSDAASYMN